MSPSVHYMHLKHIHVLTLMTNIVYHDAAEKSVHVSDCYAQVTQRMKLLTGQFQQEAL